MRRRRSEDDLNACTGAHSCASRTVGVELQVVQSLQRPSSARKMRRRAGKTSRRTIHQSPYYPRYRSHTIHTPYSHTRVRARAYMDHAPELSDRCTCVQTPMPELAYKSQTEFLVYPDTIGEGACSSRIPVVLVASSPPVRGRVPRELQLAGRAGWRLSVRRVVSCAVRPVSTVRSENRVRWSARESGGVGSRDARGPRRHGWPGFAIVRLRIRGSAQSLDPHRGDNNRGGVL